jgi:hypothetical protein
MQGCNRAFSIALRKSGMKNEEILHGFEEERSTILTIKEGRLTALVTSCAGTAFEITSWKEK